MYIFVKFRDIGLGSLEIGNTGMELDKVGMVLMVRYKDGGIYKDILFIELLSDYGVDYIEVGVKYLDSIKVLLDSGYTKYRMEYIKESDIYRFWIEIAFGIEELQLIRRIRELELARVMGCMDKDVLDGVGILLSKFSFEERKHLGYG